MEFLLEGRGEVCGHLSNSVAGSVADPRVLRSRVSRGQSTASRIFILKQLSLRFSYGVGAEEEDEADDLLEDGLHLLVAALADGRQRHQSGVAVLPVSWRQKTQWVDLTLSEI